MLVTCDKWPEPHEMYTVSQELHPNFVPVLSSATSAEPLPSSYIAESSAPGVAHNEIVVTPSVVLSNPKPGELWQYGATVMPSPTLNGAIDNRTLPDDHALCPLCFPHAVANAPAADKAQQTVQPGTKYDGSKPRVDLLPIYPILEEAKVLTYGAAKYDARNWEKGFDWSRAYGALLRHLFAFWQGEDIDPESGLHHLAHAACELDFLFEFTRTHKEFDDRPGQSGKTTTVGGN